MHTSSHIRPFIFDSIFALPETDPSKASTDELHLEIAALRADLALMQQDQAALVAAARAEAFEAGLQQARDEREAAMLAAVDALQASLEMLDERMDEIASQVARDGAEVSLAAADLLAGRAIARDPALSIDEAIGRVLKQVARGQELLVRVSPAVIEEVERLIAARQASDRRRLNLQVVSDPSLAPGDAFIEWDQGALALDADARRQAILAELEALMPAA
ncbi:flagellar assembly protein FliH [Sphingomonas sp. OV641]|uniref:FliH/SctL family protein n=1 Tax=Sphingomonas sp. OV641 TaxID=1881068 RepID=UPI0008D17057|nr:FliH/SctL family protein [Sphingomonas sp. OV641]SEI78235.1 flagellar assembly protein FliH [Sphingomonas sp. OV641]